MADALRLILLVVVTAPRIALAAGPCDEERGRTGIAVTAGTVDGVAIADVEPDSAAATAGLARGDIVVQANGTLPRSCSEYARAVRDARRERKALLLLVRRAGTDIPLVLGAATWDREVAAVPPPPPAEAPSVRRLVATPPPAPLPAAASVTLDEVTRGLSALETAERPSAQLASYRRDLVLLHRQVETLAARGAAPANVLDGLHTVLGYYDAAAVAWASEEAGREGTRRPRHVPSAEGATAPYFEGSDVAAAIDEFPFLRETVVRDPEPAVLGGESAGLWRPRQARTLLWQRGREELARFTTWLAAGSR